MRNFALTFVAAMVVAFAFATSTQAAEFSADLEWRSRYIINPVVLVVDRPVEVLNLHLTFDKGWYLNTWQAADGARRMVEGDYTIGYVWSQPAGPWSIDLSLNYYDIYQIGRFVDGDLLAPIARVDYALSDQFVPFGGTASLHGVFEWYSYLGDTSEVGYYTSDGSVAYAGVEANWLLWRKLDLTVGVDYGYATLDRYDNDFVKASAGIGWAFTEKTGLKVMYDHRFGAGEDIGSWTVSISHTF